MNLIFERSIQQSKALPDLSDTGPGTVRIALDGTVTDVAFLRYIERLGAARLSMFRTQDLLVLDHLRREEAVPEHLRPRIAALREAGVIESEGRGRGTRYFLSRRFHAALGKKGTYTRQRGLDREASKALLLQHLRNQERVGCPMAELQQVLPNLSRSQIKRLLDELRSDGEARLEGTRRWARWFPGQESS